MYILQMLCLNMHRTVRTISLLLQVSEEYSSRTLL